MVSHGNKRNTGVADAVKCACIILQDNPVSMSVTQQDGPPVWTLLTVLCFLVVMSVEWMQRSCTSTRVPQSLS